MFVLKKGFRLTTSLAFFFPGNECVNLAIAGLFGAGIYFLAAAGYLFSPVLSVIALLLFVCIPFCRIYKQVCFVLLMRKWQSKSVFNQAVS